MWRDTIVPVVVSQHAAEAAILWQIRSRGTTQANFALMYLDRFDSRVAAHLDGLMVAAEEGLRLCQEGLADPSAGHVFAAASCALHLERPDALRSILALTEALPSTANGLISALGWAEPAALEGVVVRLIGSENPFLRTVGLSACAVHRVEPPATASHIQHQSPAVRARAFRAAGEIGALAYLSSCAAAARDEDPDVRFWASWAAVLLGNRGVALDELATWATRERLTRRAFDVVLQVLPVERGHAHLQQLAKEPSRTRWLMRGAGVVGDTSYVPWLIKQMASDEHSRPAGEAFSMIIGIDLALYDLERKPPADFEPGPNDNPDDPNVDMDPDEGLPWPDPDKVQAWWDKNSSRFQPGVRYFMGAPVTREHCIEVLKNGYQRQRILAAHYLCLLDPGTPLFNTSAPAWRQQKLLAQMA